MSHLLPPLPFETTLITAPIRAAPLSFSPKRPNMTFTLLFECFFWLSFFIYLTERSEGRKLIFFIVYYESTTSLLTGENRSKSFESHIIMLTKIRKSFPFSKQFQKWRSRNTTEVHQSVTLIFYLCQSMNYRSEFLCNIVRYKISFPIKTHKYSLDYNLFLSFRTSSQGRNGEVLLTIPTSSVSTDTVWTLLRNFLFFPM